MNLSQFDFLPSQGPFAQRTIDVLEIVLLDNVSQVMVLSCDELHSVSSLSRHILQSLLYPLVSATCVEYMFLMTAILYDLGIITKSLEADGARHERFVFW